MTSNINEKDFFLTCLSVLNKVEDNSTVIFNSASPYPGKFSFEFVRFTAVLDWVSHILVS